jgi:hypothetical protein
MSFDLDNAEGAARAVVHLERLPVYVRQPKGGGDGD